MLFQQAIKKNKRFNICTNSKAVCETKLVQCAHSQRKRKYITRELYFSRTGAKICRGFEGQKSRCRDKAKCQKSRHCRGKNRKNRGDVAAEIVKIAGLSRQIS